ncbi:hypothetical protein OF83DRAFT_1106376 [Amylostereum chailletii]|nr:hypothetical protein OF83DRAFT_1106376 [Amylostereum chailletii]
MLAVLITFFNVWTCRGPQRLAALVSRHTSGLRKAQRCSTMTLLPEVVASNSLDSCRPSLFGSTHRQSRQQAWRDGDHCHRRCPEARPTSLPSRLLSQTGHAPPAPIRCPLFRERTKDFLRTRRTVLGSLRVDRSKS